MGVDEMVMAREGGREGGGFEEFGDGGVFMKSGEGVVFWTFTCRFCKRHVAL